MDIIFLDTSIFEANNFLESKRIQEIYKLAERGDIKVVLPKLTYDEIINRISKNIDESSSKFKKYRDDTRILRNVPSISKKLEPFDSDKVKEELNVILKDRFSQSNFEIIEYTTLNIEEIFRSYS
ncbi:MAG: PIN domain-containing protein [Arachidicoccus sp.]|nr:PIN domain-containing protein [Arachidicoccus sp.]